MRSAEQCLTKASEMELIALASPSADMVIAYERLAASWRDIARAAAWQDDVHTFPLPDQTVKGRPFAAVGHQALGNS